jgi:hypothetical protein
VSKHSVNDKNESGNSCVASKNMINFFTLSDINVKIKLFD